MPVLLAAQRRLAAARGGGRPDGGDGDDHSPRRRRCSSISAQLRSFVVLVEQVGYYLGPADDAEALSCATGSPPTRAGAERFELRGSKHGSHDARRDDHDRFATIGNIDPSTGTLATPLQVPNNGAPGAMPLGPDGNLWAIDTRPGPPPALLRITAAGSFAAFPLAAGSAPSVLCAGPDGNLWISENGTSPNMTRLVPSTGAITAFPVP